MKKLLMALILCAQACSAQMIDWTQIKNKPASIGLWTSCTSGYVKWDGTCDTPAGDSAAVAADLVTETERAVQGEAVALSWARAAVTPQKLQGQYYTFGNDTGTANNYAVTITPSIPAMTPPTQISFQALHTNTGESTLSVGQGYPYSIFKRGGTAPLVAGDIVAGQIVTVVYDGTLFEMQSPVANAAGAGLAGVTQTGTGGTQTTTFAGSIAAVTTVSAPQVTVSGTPTNPTDAITVAYLAAHPGATGAAGALAAGIGPTLTEGVKQTVTSVVPDAGYDWSQFIGSDNLLHCQLSAALGGGSCAPTGSSSGTTYAFSMNGSVISTSVAGAFSVNGTVI